MLYLIFCFTSLMYAKRRKSMKCDLRIKRNSVFILLLEGLCIQFLFFAMHSSFKTLKFNEWHEFPPLSEGLLKNRIWASALRSGLRIRIRSDPVFLHGSGSTFQISLDPDPVFKFLWIRFQPRFWNKKIAERSLKVIYQKKT